MSITQSLGEKIVLQMAQYSGQCSSKRDHKYCQTKSNLFKFSLSNINKTVYICGC